MESQTQGSSHVPSPAPRTIEEVDTVVIRFAGDSGDGMQLTGTEFTRASAMAGNDLATLPDYPSEIRAPAGTLAGVSGFQVHFGSREIYTPGDHPDVLVAMNPAALKVNLADLRRDGTVIVNTGAFTPANLEKAAYKSNPLEDGTLASYRTYKVDISKLTEAALAETGLGSKDVGRCKNFWALGLMFWMYNRPIETELEAIKKKFGKNPKYVEANTLAFMAGYQYGDTAEIFQGTYRVKAAAIEPGLYRNLTGNSATALGLVAAAHMSGLELFLGSYPITPASEILHDLSAYRNFGVTTFQCEDEIAGICSAIGAAYGGALAATTSSGPGIALKSEAIGLAVILELPLVIVNVQRGGPSTGLPTKMEAADLMQAVYGRNGECPLPVLAALTPADCFWAALEAARIALKYMTPVMLLTDGYLGQGSEPFKVPKAEDLPRFPMTFRTDPEGYLPYKRDPETLARDWVRPGTPGLEHRIGGLEKHALTGNVSHDPQNHELMCRTRAEKVAGIAREIDDLIMTGPDEGELLVIGWGSTYGAIARAVELMRQKGKEVTHVQLRWLNPLPPKLGTVIKRFKRVIVPELNLGQLTKLLRSEYLVDARGLNKIQGKPFKVSEIVAGIEAASQDN